MKDSFIIGIVVLVCSCTVSANPDGKNLDGEWDPEGYLSVTWQERYIGLRVSGLFYEDPMLWTELFLNLPKGFFADFWLSTDTQDGDINSSWGDEFDFTLGWMTSWNKLDVIISASQYVCLPSNHLWGSGNAWSADLIVSRDVESPWKDHSFTLSFWTGYLAMNDEFEKGAAYLLPNVKHTWKHPFGIGGCTFSQTAMFAWDDGFNSNSSDGVFLRWMPSLNWKLTDSLNLTAPGFIWVNPLTDPHDGRGEEKSVNFAINYSF